MRKRIVIVDIDGTLANGKHRAHYLEKEPKDWASFDAAMHLDPPHEVVARLVRTLWRGDHNILLVTSRQECDRLTTEQWLAKHRILHDGLYMRKTGDRRSDAEVKKEILDHYINKDQVAFVIDDRNSVVKMWRDAGLVCLQCAEGDY